MDCGAKAGMMVNVVFAESRPTSSSTPGLSAVPQLLPQRLDLSMARPLVRSQGWPGEMLARLMVKMYIGLSDI